MMPKVELQDVTVRFPVFGARDRSFRSLALHRASGGHIASSGHHRAVVTALDHISFKLRPGDRLGVVGHNGSGKSTLLRVIAGIYRPAEGRVAVEGRIASLLDIALGLDPDATGFENIYLRAYLLGHSRREVDKRVDQIVDFSGLGEFLDLPMRSYSAGMTIRLGFSIVTAFDADIVLVDEWLSVGDAEFLEKSSQRLRDLTTGSTILVVASHNESLVNSICTQTLRLNQGTATLASLETQEKAEALTLPET